MRLIHLTFINLCMLLLLSCESDSGTIQPLSQDDLQGKWFLSELNANQPVDLNNDGNGSTDLTTETDCFDTMSIKFDNDSYRFSYPKIEFTGENDQTLICNDTINEGTYQLSDQTLTATTIVDGTAYTENVAIELTNDRLKFRITSTQVSEYLNLSTVENENSDLEFLEFVFEK